MAVLAAMLAPFGCSEPDSTEPAVLPAPTFPGVKVTVAALEDAGILASLAPQRGEWVASRGGEMILNEQPITSLDELGDAHLLIFPGRRMGDLVDADLVEPISQDAIFPSGPWQEPEIPPARDESTKGRPADPYLYLSILPVYRDQATKYGSDRMALPLGGSGLVVAYRRDAFSRPDNIAAAGAAGLKLEPPATWTQLDALAKFFQGRDWNGDGKPDHGIAAVLGQDPEDLGNTTFLARAASLGQHRDQFSFLFDSDTMTPRLESPPFVEALRGVLTWKDLGPPGMEALTPAAAREAFRLGKVAMLVDRAERVTEWSGGHPIGVSPLPGSERVFEPLRRQWENPTTPNSPSYLPLGGGWFVGIRRGLSGTQQAAALDLAKYLTSPEIANRVASERGFLMLPVRAKQLVTGLVDPTSAPDVESRQWTESVSRTLMAERVVPGLRIPGADLYLKELALGRVSALQGTEPEAALRAVAARWTALTKERGKARQLWHYRRSLNSLATLPQPPERGK